MAKKDSTDSSDLGLFFHPVVSHSAYEETLAQLVRAIRVGAVSVGDKFPSETDLSDLFEVSRSTVREAMRSLGQAGYVRTTRGRFGGTFLVQDSPSGLPVERGPALLDALDLRLAIEPGAAALAARREQPREVEAMKELVARIEAAERPAVIRLNCQLHMLIGQASGNQTLESSIRTIELQVMEAGLAMPKLTQSKQSHRQHRAIVDAIEAGAPKVAREEMETHLIGAEAIMRELAVPKQRTRRKPRKKRR